MQNVVINSEYITLGQALKLAGAVGSGVEAKMLILDEQVEVNGEIDTRRGKKLYEGDTFTVLGKTYVITK